MARFVVAALVAGLGVGSLAQGCAALFDASQGPRPYGGTRLLLADPLPGDGSQDAPVLASALWLFDLPLSVALDTALLPFAAGWALGHDEPPAPEPAVALELTRNRG